MKKSNGEVVDSDKEEVFNWGKVANILSEGQFNLKVEDIEKMQPILQDCKTNRDALNKVYENLLEFESEFEDVNLNEEGGTNEKIVDKALENSGVKPEGSFNIKTEKSQRDLSKMIVETLKAMGEFLGATVTYLGKNIADAGEAIFQSIAKAVKSKSVSHERKLDLDSTTHGLEKQGAQVVNPVAEYFQPCEGEELRDCNGILRSTTQVLPQKVNSSKKLYI